MGTSEVCGVYEAECLIFRHAVRRVEPNGVQPWEQTQQRAATRTGCTEQVPLIETMTKKEKKEKEHEDFFHNM